MEIKKIIQKGIDGGWREDFDGFKVDEKQKPRYEHSVVISANNKFISYELNLNDIVLDPNFWKAVGKVEYIKTWGRDNFPSRIEEWAKKKMHNMIDHLNEGKSLEDYIKSLK